MFGAEGRRTGNEEQNTSSQDLARRLRKDTEAMTLHVTTGDTDHGRTRRLRKDADTDAETIKPRPASHSPTPDSFQSPADYR